MTPTVLVAPDKFKGSLAAKDVAAALSEGLRGAGVTSVQLPLADGGDGSVDAAVAAGYAARAVTVADATGQPHRAHIARSGSVAVVEVANTCGLATLHGGRRQPMHASSVGFGQAIREALTTRPATVVLALGGSASTDGGAGMLTAMGFEFRDADGQAVHPGGGDLRRIAAVDATRVIDVDEVDFVVAGDVTNPLLGPHGAAAVYGPQKGADTRQIELLEEGLAHLVAVLRDAGFGHAESLAHAPGAGAAGGIGFAAMLMGARMSSGAEHFLDLLDFTTVSNGADVVVTGEGCLDEQTMQGKLLSALIARAHPKPVIAVAGRTTLSCAQQSSAGFAAVHTLGQYTDGNTESDSALTYRTLTRIGRTIGSELVDLDPSLRNPCTP
jgi:glycerate 2-kinase